MFRVATVTVLLTLMVLAGVGRTEDPNASATTRPQEGTTMASADKPVVVEMETSMGKISIELNAAKAPLSVANFLQYVDGGFYDGTIFHRVIPTFMIQGGGFTADMKQKPTKGPIKNEANNGLSNARGTISMARTNDPDSATAQFFINVQDNAGLDYQGPRNYGYAVFGKVIAGMDVVDKIRNVETGNAGMHQDVPRQPVIIVKAARKAG